MFQEYYIQEGQVIRNTNDNPANGLFSLFKWFKKAAKRANVPFADTCCTADNTNQPVRFNTATSHLEYFNVTNNTWTTVPHL